MDARLDYVFDFLRDLARNNTRAWMHTRMNEKRYDVVQRTMYRWISMLMLDMQDIEETHGLKAKNLMYRIWRDTRFSSDKTPCKTYLSFLIRHGGRKNERRAAYYVQIGPGGQSFIGGGLYMPDSERLRLVRAALVRDGERLVAIMADKKFKKTFGELEPLKLKTMPRDFRTVDVSPPVRELLRHTSWVVGLDLTDNQVLAKDFDHTLVEIFRVLKPFNDWLSDALHSR